MKKEAKQKSAKQKTEKAVKEADPKSTVSTASALR